MKFKKPASMFLLVSLACLTRAHAFNLEACIQDQSDCGTCNMLIPGDCDRSRTCDPSKLAADCSFSQPPTTISVPPIETPPPPDFTPPSESPENPPITTIVTGPIEAPPRLPVNPVICTMVNHHLECHRAW